MNRRNLLTVIALLLTLSCNLFNPAPPTPSSDLFATLQASTPSGLASPIPSLPVPTSVFNPPPTVASTLAGGTTTVPFASAADGLTGHIVYTCQVYKVQAANQICIMNADGTGMRQLTNDASRQHYYPSLSPDGASVMYAAFREENIYELYEMTLADGDVNQLSNKWGVLNAPEISPNGKFIVFMRWTAQSDSYQIWVMNRDGSEAGNVAGITGWDPTWAPDSSQILFASDMNGPIQLFAVKKSGANDHQISNLPAIRGRSDWSPDGQFIVTYSGEPWKHEVYLMNADGSNAHIISPTGGNAQGPSFSPDGQWVTFTAYYDRFGDDHGCEIYVMKLDGSNLRRLTNNDYCDYQPRWGP